MLARIAGDLSPAVKLKFLQDVMYVVLYCLQFYLQTHNNFFIAQPLLHQGNHLALPACKVCQVEGLQALPFASPLCDVVEEDPGDFRGTEHLSRGHRTHAMNEILEGCLLGEIASSSGFNASQNVRGQFA